GFLIAPPIVKRQLERHLSAALHREVVIRRLQLNPCVFSATVDGLAIRESDGRPFLGCERLYINFGAWSFLTNNWLFQEIALTAPSARLEIAKDGSLNIADLLAPSAGKQHRAVRIRRLTVTQARFVFADHSRAQDFVTELGPISFSLKDFSTAPAPGAPYEFTAITESDELLHWRGTLSAKPLSSAGEFTLDRIALKKYAPYYSSVISGDVLAGALDVTGNYEINLSSEPRVANFTGGRLHLRGFQLAPHGGVSPVLDLPSVNLTGLDVSLAPLKISAVHLDSAGGRIVVRRAADGKFNLAAIFSPVPSLPEISAATAATVKQKAPPALPNIALGQIAIHGLAATFDDATTPHPAHNAITSLDLSARSISSAAGAAPIPVQLALHFAPQGSLTFSGTIAFVSGRADLEVDLKNFSVASLAPYIEPFARLRFPQGIISTQGRLVLNTSADAAPSVAFRGDAELDQFAAVDAGGENFASLASLGFKQLDFKSNPLSFGVAQVSLLNPSFNYIRRKDGTTNFAAALRSETSAAPQEPGSTAPPGPLAKIRIGRVVVANGTFIFSDRTIEPNAQFSVDKLAGMISDLSSDPSSRAGVNLRGKVDDTAPVSITGLANVFGGAIFADLTASCAGADLLPTDPYFGKYAGYKLDRGDLTCDIKLRLAERRLDSHTSTTLDQFTLGEKTNSSAATHLPVRLAVALLKDASGKIVLDIPVAGSLDDPNFQVGGVALKFVVDLLAKAAAAPFSLLGAVFGGGDRQTREQLDHVEFAEGSSALSAEETHKLDLLARALVARPGLSLGITGEADPAADGQALAKQKIAQAIRQRIWDS
ncbi:MAG: DUF748 domain-containing protein, partial [Verrucomicrobiota bacterium]|nr:DUF748 domain-containing protein [Verrucomicrobiota bacterium]